MIPFTDFKKLLGPYGERLTDEQVKRLRDIEYQIANAIFDQWLPRRNKQLQQVGYSTSLQHNVLKGDSIGEPTSVLPKTAIDENDR